MWRTLGILLGTATVISLVKSGFAIELHGLPAKLHQQYVWLRDMLFEPVVWVLRYIGLNIPSWLKDVITAYGLVAVAHWRAVPGTRYVSREGWIGLEGRFEIAIFWPTIHFRWNTDLLILRRKFQSLVLLNLLAVIFFAAAFFPWNHVQNVMGPSG